MTVLHDNSGNAIDQNNPLAVDAGFSTGVLPVDVQNHLTSTIQTHNAVSIALSGSSIQGNGANFAPCDGYAFINISITNDNNTSTMSGALQWSFDGTNVHGADSIFSNQAINSWTNSKSYGETPIKAPYFRLALVNGDATAAHTVSAWAYLKA